jgi:hypothetical protein
VRRRLPAIRQGCNGTGGPWHRLARCDTRIHGRPVTAPGHPAADSGEVRTGSDGLIRVNLTESCHPAKGVPAFRRPAVSERGTVSNGAGTAALHGLSPTKGRMALPGARKSASPEAVLARFGCAKRLHRSPSRPAISTQARLLEIVIRLDDVAQLVLGGAVTAIGVRMMAFDELLEARFDLGMRC